MNYFSPTTSTAIIRVSRDHFRTLWAALSFITNLPNPWGTPCVMNVVRVSGTIRKAEEEAIRRARGLVRRVRIDAEDNGLGNDEDILVGILGTGTTGDGMVIDNESDGDSDSDEDD